MHDPICTESGNLSHALHGSFLPIPSQDLFPPFDASLYGRENAPGAVIVRKEKIAINAGRKRTRLRVTNHGDRPVQIGSHYHFIETNCALVFDRGLAYGKRLDIPSGTAVRFEPGDFKTVTLVPISGARVITGGNRLASLKVDVMRSRTIVAELMEKGFGHRDEPGALEISEDTTMSRESYASMYGPTVGDRIRLGDTALWIEIERDMVRASLWTVVCSNALQAVYGDEVKFGGGECQLRGLSLSLTAYLGKSIREGMGQSTDRSSKHTLDLLITNCVIVDWAGIYKVLLF